MKIRKANLPSKHSATVPGFTGHPTRGWDLTSGVLSGHKFKAVGNGPFIDGEGHETKGDIMEQYSRFMSNARKGHAGFKVASNHERMGSGTHQAKHPHNPRGKYSTHRNRQKG